MNEIQTALLDVRKAYRLLYLYQRRTMDIIQRISKEFDCQLYGWSPTKFTRPSQFTTNALNRWAWDMLPMYDVSFLFLKTGADNNKHLKGDWMLEITAVSDSGYKFTDTGEPDPKDFFGIEESKTQIVFYFHYSMKDSEFNWYYDYWNIEDEYPKENQFDNDELGLRIFSQAYDWSEFTDESAIVSVTNDFKQLLKERLELNTI